MRATCGAPEFQVALQQSLEKPKVFSRVFSVQAVRIDPPSNSAVRTGSWALGGSRGSWLFGVF
jgi:hypothetical protein